MTSTSSSPHSIDWISTIGAFAHLFRLPVSMLAALAGCATIYALNAATPLQQYLLTATILIGMTSAACAINDYWDLDKDRIDHSDRPLPSGLLSLQQAWWAAVILFGCALSAAVPLGLYPFILVTASTVLLWNYSHLLTYSGIVGNVVVAAIVAALIFLGSLVADRPFAMLYPTWFLFCYALAKEIIWDVHDAEGDRSQGIVTVANRWGAPVAFSITWGLLGVLMGSIPVALHLLPMAHPLLFAVFSLVALLSLATALARYQQQPSAIAYQRLVLWERLSVVFGVLALLATAPPL
ncbi:geranylgeranylglycerol-phosphate geranylgeranyltransferase [Chroococcidiopsis sp. CCMEE 29]|uniref:geranylgeranylglycerol-phosphate geranylgeranyltransferase n=1 Tax=Chroococcidiopsis sp. CCMEE 29 TaxID=155894 RepID=UPI002020382F|nr:geranylgeranylglycerol-phosphate geranylgeranyltransferase [Chroococcidiopsis sp. CCMEE 29]